VAQAHGAAVHATQLLGAAATLIAGSGPADPAAAALYNQQVAATRAALDPVAWQAAWAAGQALTPAQVVALAGAPI
jgi:hypothetical protein